MLMVSANAVETTNGQQMEHSVSYLLQQYAEMDFILIPTMFANNAEYSIMDKYHKVCAQFVLDLNHLNAKDVKIINS